MGRTVKKLVLSGYYGYRNSGDEAVLQSILLALHEEGEREGIAIEPIVLSADPALTERMYGVRAVHRMKPGQVLSAIRESDGLISGGGSLLQDTTGWKSIPYYLGVIQLAQWLGKPVFVYSQGIGPVNRREFDPFISGVFKRCAYVSVRDPESADLLRRMGYTKPIEVVPDPVMGLPLREREVSSAGHDAAKPVIGVSVRYWNKDRSELDGIAYALKRILSEEQAEIRFLPFHLPTDEEASRDVMRRMAETASNPSVSIIGPVEHPQDMLREVSRCDVLIGMRLHSLIYAASQYVPVVGISYDPKIDGFLRRLDQKPAASTETFDGDRVAAEALRLLRGKQTWQREKEALIKQLKKESHQPAKQIAVVLRQKGGTGR